MKTILFLLLASLAVAGCSETDYDKLPEAVVTATTNNKSNSAGNNSSDSTITSNSGRARHKTRGTTSHYCNYPTRKGRPCKRLVQGTSGYCWQHTH